MFEVNRTEWLVAPNVTQLTPWTVRLSWNKTLIRGRNCIDHFSIRFWKPSVPKYIKFLPILGKNITQVDLEVVPETLYIFQLLIYHERNKSSNTPSRSEVIRHSKRTTYQTSFDALGICIYTELDL